MSLFAVTIGSVKIIPFDIQDLPRPSGFPDFDDNFYYFAYSKESLPSKELVEHLLSINHLEQARVKDFESEKEAYHYFNVKNIVLNSRDVDEHLANEIIC